MSSRSLPTRGKFLDDLEIIENCDICHDSFDDKHKIARTKCQHIFGLTCLTAWINSSAEQSNTCPMCRQPLFIKTKGPVFSEGLNPDSGYFSLEIVTYERSARKIVRSLWRAMRSLLSHDVIYDSDIEARIFTVGYGLRETSGRMFNITPEHLINLRTVAKDMIREQTDKQQSGTLESRDSPLNAEVWSRWLPPVIEVFGWQFKEPAARLPSHAIQLPGRAVQLPGRAVQLPGRAVQLPGRAVQLPGPTVQLPLPATVPPGHAGIFLRALFTVICCLLIVYYFSGKDLHQMK